jgi:thiamine-phosphate pyrophosphorylase
MTDRARLVLVTPRFASQDAAAPDQEAAGRDDSAAPPAAPLAGWADRLFNALSAAFEGGPVDAVLLNLPPADERTLVKLIKPVVALGQEKGAAMLLVDAPEIVARAGADGVHVSRPDAVQAALDMLKPHERIVGCGGARARHEAMEVAEAGCDYLMFGEPREDASLPPLPAVLERAQWWAEVFETPCVAFVPSLDEVSSMAATGCEFVALGDAVFSCPQGPAEAVRQALAAIAAAPAPQR